MVHSFKGYSVILGSQEITGFHENGIEVTPDGEGYTKTVGIDGFVVFNDDANESATFTLNLLQTAPSNGYLSGIFIAAKEGGVVEHPFLIRDENSNTIYTSPNAVVKQIPPSTKVGEVDVLPWQILCGKVVSFEG